MSIVSFTKTSIHKHAGAGRVSIKGRQSGRITSQEWISVGPFGTPDTLASAMFRDGLRQTHTIVSTHEYEYEYAPPTGAPIINAGFSLHGGRRDSARNRIGRDMKMSQSGTPFRGIHPKGYGGRRGTYVQAQPIMHVTEVGIQLRASQSHYVKPIVVSARGQMNRRNRHNYVNGVVQPIFTGNLTANSSAGLYTERLTAQYNQVTDSNNANNTLISTLQAYREGCENKRNRENESEHDANPNETGEVYTYTQSCGTHGTGAHGTGTRGGARGSGGYTKRIRQAVDASEQIMRAGRTCGLAGASIPVYPGPKNVSAGCYSRPFLDTL